MKKLELDVDPCIKTMATRMICKFDKYWGSLEKMNITICFALVLDPRCKLEILRFCLCNLYGPLRGKMQVEKLKTEMYMLYDEYVKEQPASSTRSVSVSEPQRRGHVES